VNRQLRALLVASFAAVAIAGCFPVSCTSGEPVGQFGAYHAQNKTLRLKTGDSLTVYRVKTWSFTNGDAPSLQLEYEPPVAVSDTAAMRRYARLIWPVFVRYLDASRFRAAIVTATNLRRTRAGLAWTSTQRSWGVLADRDSSGHWFFRDDPVALPLADTSASAGIYEYSGAPLLPSQIVPPPN
jgi:hypothetical protein